MMAKNSNKKPKKYFLAWLAGALLISALVFSGYLVSNLSSSISFVNKDIKTFQKKEEKVPPVPHVELPEQVKAIYMTSWVAGTKNFRNSLVNLIDTTELNAVVIDIKDYTGKIAFEVEDEFLEKYASTENRIPDIKAFLAYLHKKNIYVIGRISVFQDPRLVELRPDLAVKTADKETVWKDKKGISWLDAGAIEVWNYVIELARYAYNLGFDEINFDYIRFPSDGNMTDIYYPFSEDRIWADIDTGKAKILREFFTYANAELSKTGAVLSADLFGMTTTNADDLNVGQILEYTLPYFDYVAPMVYPSHYPSGFIGLGNPAVYPYKVVKYSLDKAVEKAHKVKIDPKKIRPWLQDFDLGADYNSAEVKAQIQATYDAGLASWMLWSAANRYTAGALLSD